eukprot:NODE_2262_length_809_cov_165.340789_g1579_i0.p4 GENE.NODE_2262_length_809_cov_165.340789_g1579_i0~~NODE_2262_length_809_cov_165.340789_g1579_i0.p4  ORF type:complete len:54 (+),score=11.00 NODE_2262_length_809_cov_165.340789_g1579_i0:564-725(+)
MLAIFKKGCMPFRLPCACAAYRRSASGSARVWAVGGAVCNAVCCRFAGFLSGK